MTSEYQARFKKKKQLPAPEEKSGKKGKSSSKKPWVLKSKWKEGVTFTSQRYEIVDGKLVKAAAKSYTLEELEALKEQAKINRTDFLTAFWGPPPYSANRYKSLKSALTSWENFCTKGKKDDRAIYWIENERTGEVVEL